jgi:hypothetical protein
MKKCFVISPIGEPDSDIREQVDAVLGLSYSSRSSNIASQHRLDHLDETRLNKLVRDANEIVLSIWGPDSEMGPPRGGIFSEALTGSGNRA